MSRDELEHIVDPSSWTCLTHPGDCCGHHDACLVAAEAVGPDGATSAWLLPGGMTSGAGGTWPRHERTGPLPVDVANRCATPTAAEVNREPR